MNSAPTIAGMGKKPSKPAKAQTQPEQPPDAGKEAVFVEIPAALLAALNRVRARTRRTKTAEIIVALERHVVAEGEQYPPAD